MICAAWRDAWMMEDSVSYGFADEGNATLKSNVAVNKNVYI